MNEVQCGRNYNNDNETIQKLILVHNLSENNLIRHNLQKQSVFKKKGQNVFLNFII